MPAWLISADGSVRAFKLHELTSGGDRKARERRLANYTVVLPPAAGGLIEGLLSGDQEWSEATEYDIADRWTDENGALRRTRLWDSEEAPAGMCLVRTIDIRPDSEEEEEEPSRRYWRWYVRPRSADDDGSKTARRAQDLDAHSRAAHEWASQLTAKLHIPQPEAGAVVFAAKWHDLGKNRDLWQRSIGNRDFPRRVLAKSEGPVPSWSMTGYRHEFGSVAEISRLPEFAVLEPDVQDLVLHLVAAHHGRARPQFPADEAFDPQHSDEICGEIAGEVPVRFARLQRKYGRWGLAYLESLVRAADALASQDIQSRQATKGAEA